MTEAGELTSDAELTDPKAIGLPPFLDARVRAVQALPHAVGTFDQTLDATSGSIDVSTLPLQTLSDILSHPDAIDFLLRKRTMGPIDLPRWQSEQIGRLTDPAYLPEDIVGENDLVAAIASITPTRPGAAESDVFSQFARVAGVSLSPAILSALNHTVLHPMLTALHPDTIPFLRKCGEAAIRTAGKNPVLLSRVASSIRAGILAQAPWWVLGGDDGEHGLDPLTKTLLETLAAHAPRQAAAAAIDLLTKKSRQDGTIIASLFASEDPALNVRCETVLFPAVDWLIGLAARGDPVVAQATVGALIDQKNIAAQSIAERIMTHPDLATFQPKIDPDGVFESCGRKFRLPGQQSVTMLNYGTALVQHPDGTIAGYLDIRPEKHPLTHEPIPVELLPMERMLSYSSLRRVGGSGTVALFLRELPALRERIRQASERGAIDMITPIPMLFELWRWEHTHPEVSPEKLPSFLKQYGLSGLTAFMAGSYDERVMDDIIRFALEASPPAIEEPESGFFRTRLYETFPETIMRYVAKLTLEAEHFAHSITTDPVSGDRIRDTLLLRAKAMLAATARRYANQGFLTDDEQAAINTSFVFYHEFLATLADPGEAAARGLRIPFEAVRELFRFHTDTDSRALFYPALELWFTTWGEAQKKAPYWGKTGALNNAFYQEYEQWMNRDSARTTAAPELERTRYVSSIDRDFEAGIIPSAAEEDDPFVIGFVGIGTGERIEAGLVRHIRTKISGEGGFRFIGIDSRPDIQRLPEGIEHKMLDMAKLGDAMPGQFDRLYLIWSPLMDVVELPERIKIYSSLAKALKQKQGATIEIDVALRYDPSFYNEAVAGYHQTHRDEPEGVVSRTYPRGERLPPLVKLLFASDPVEIIGIMSQHGLRCTNVSPDPGDILRLCNEIRTGDTAGIPQRDQHDLDKTAPYLTPPPSNTLRMTFKFVREFTAQPSMDLLGAVATASMPS